MASKSDLSSRIHLSRYTVWRVLQPARERHHIVITNQLPMIKIGSGDFCFTDHSVDQVVI